MKVICFDLGGVLVRIRHTWQEALVGAGVDSPLLSQPTLGIPDLKPFVDYQDESINEDTYGPLLSEFLGCSTAEALKVHDAILIDEYPGVPELIADLNDAGFGTSCLSNTNGRHWEELMNPTLYPGLARLRRPLASHLLRVNKPAEAAYRAVEAVFPEGESFVFFDDAIVNVEAARSLGWTAHRIDPNSDTVAEIRRHLGIA